MKTDQLVDSLSAALKSSSSDEIQAYCESKREAPTRFANNQITFEAETEQTMVTFRSYRGKRIGTAKVNGLGREGLEDAVRRADESAAHVPEFDDVVLPLGPQEMPRSAPVPLLEEDFAPETRGRIVELACRRGRKEKIQCAGYVAIMREARTIVTSRGLTAHSETNIIDCSLTARTEDGKGSGWSGGWAPHLKDIDADAIIDRAIDLAHKSAGAEAIEPGSYPVVLSPIATEYFLYNWSHHLDAHMIHKGLSSLSGEKDQQGLHQPRIGEQVMSSAITVKRQIDHPLVRTFAFDRDGVPSKPITYVENGVLKNIHYTLPYAIQTGEAPTGEKDILLMEGSKKTVEQLISGIDHGVFVNRVWYVRWVDPKELVVTGLTRDGTFWIEDGEIKRPTKNLRFNESLVKLFSEVKEIGETTRYWVWPYVSPAMSAPSFHFTSSTDSI